MPPTSIQVKGYASAVGNAAFNQELSEERAENVTNILVQQGHVDQHVGSGSYG